jgi:hypothetical protein
LINPFFILVTFLDRAPNYSENPHIKALGNDPVIRQLERPSPGLEYLLVPVKLEETSVGFVSTYAHRDETFLSQIFVSDDLEPIWKGHSVTRCSTKDEAREKYFPDQPYIKVSSQRQYLRIGESLAIFGCKSCIAVNIQEASNFQILRKFTEATFLEHSYLCQLYHLSRSSDPSEDVEYWLPLDPLVVKQLKTYDWSNPAECQAIIDRVRRES